MHFIHENICARLRVPLRRTAYRSALLCTPSSPKQGLLQSLRDSSPAFQPQSKMLGKNLSAVSVLAQRDSAQVLEKASINGLLYCSGHKMQNLFSNGAQSPAANTCWQHKLTHEGRRYNLKCCAALDKKKKLRLQWLAMHTVIYRTPQYSLSLLCP